MRLNELKGAPGARKKRKIVGRGPGSGHGKTAAKGHKGQLARAGGGKGPGFEGGQMPLQRRMIKRGFTNIFRKEYQIVNLDCIDKYFKKGEVVSPETMIEKGLINKGGEVKVLCRGELQNPLVIRANKFSRNAVARIEQAGGTAEVI